MNKTQRLPITYKTTLIYNPTAGPWDVTRPLKRLAAYLGKAGWQAELVQTTRQGDAMRHAREAAAQGVDLVLIAGGDGTINEAVNGLCNSDTTLGIVPAGTGNILAHQLRMPVLSAVAPMIKEIGDTVLASRVQRVDVGTVNDRRFISWAGLGLDAEIAAQMEPRPRHIKRLSILPYIIAGFTVASDYRGVRSSFLIEDRAFRTRTLMAVASNIQLYAAFLQIAPQARMDDGLLDIFVFKGLGLSYALKYLMQSFSGRHLASPDVMHVLASKMQVETSPPVAVHLDGDPYGCTPATLSIEPAALKLLVPPQAPASLFSKRPESLQAVEHDDRLAYA
ncbi:MAG: diacylglycerol/lipid kinase family protein [Anaerolineae bacterium]